MSSYFLFALVLTLTALCFIDDSNALVLWLSGAAVVLNVVLIASERRLRRKPDAKTPAIILPESPFTENEKTDIRAQLERLRYPRRVTVRDVLRRPDNGAINATDRGQVEKRHSGTCNAVPSQDKGGAL